jgi:hypothetical protein
VRFRPSLLTIGYLLAAASTLVGGVAVNTVKPSDGAVPWLWALTAAFLVGGLIVDITNRRREARRVLGENLDGLADDLAAAVHAQWWPELQRFRDPIEIPVRWKAAPARLMDQWINIHRAVGDDPGPIELSGRLDEVAAVYRKIPSGRLVILGERGAGKTVLAVRLALDLIATRSPGAPVPVILNLSSWDPSVDVWEWLPRQIGEQYLGSAKVGTEPAHRMLERGLLLPVLDGFDEVAAAHRAKVLCQLGMLPDHPFVLTSRFQQYEAALEKPVPAAAVIQVRALNLEDVSQYLGRRRRWEPVIETLRMPSIGKVLVRALSTPLMLNMARIFYDGRSVANPAELLDRARFMDRNAIEDHFVAGFIPAVYQRCPRWTGQEAEDWLRYLAGHLQRDFDADGDADGNDRAGRDLIIGSDLAWWRIRDTVSDSVRLMLGVLIAVVAAAPMFIMGVDRNYAFLTLGMLLTIIMATVGARARSPLPRRTRLGLPRRGFRFQSAYLFAAVPAIGLGAYLSSTIGLNLLVVAAEVLYIVVLLLLGNERTVDLRTAAYPVALLAVDRRHALVKAAGLTLITTIGYLITGVVVQHLDARLIYCPIVTSLAYGVLAHAWGQWLVVVRVWLPLRGRLPWAVVAFLEDAHARGILRKIGAVYQFRHILIQTYLQKPRSSQHPAEPAGGQIVAAA